MSRYRDVALFVALAAVWGSAFLAIKTGLEAGLPPVLFAALRYDVAGIIMLAYAAWRIDHWIPRGRAEWTMVAAGATLMIAAYHAFLFVGETDPAVTSAVAAVLVALSPVLTTVFSRLFVPDEPVTPATVGGTLLALVGVAVLVRPDPANLLAGGVVAKTLVFLAAASFALGSVLTKVPDADLPIETMEAWSMAGGALIMHVISLGVGESQVFAVSWTTNAVLSLLYLSLAASAVGFLLYFHLLERLGPIEINMVSYVAPIFAALAGWAVRDEVPTAYTVLGFLVIFAGFALVKRDALREEVSSLRRVLSS
ncbi:EamA family transporter [Halorubellus sp. PRR65]|uniref:DMT family transporter n=1 Tax=Halorubellus sp. PRR65 TaxID=3098148 RepID=UPI002B257C91|nr:EamA family transporter [Halorubellus sp. PRR65]